MIGRLFKTALILAVIAAAGFGAVVSREKWRHWIWPVEPQDIEAPIGQDAPPADRVFLSEQAQANLALAAQPLKAESFWKSLSVPGIIIDRPGISDRNVVTPVNSVIAAIHHVPGDSVQAGTPLFTLRILSEALSATQTELFKATQEMQLARTQRLRMASAGGAVPEAKLLEMDNQIARLDIAARAYRQDLLSRGFTAEQIAGVADGRFVNEIVIAAPGRAPAASTGPDADFALEIQELKVEMGQHVQVGQALCLLADHRQLSIEGRAFREETPQIERAVREGWPVEVDFQEPPGADWPPYAAPLHINRLGNTIDPGSRTFSFLIPIENQSRTVDRNGRRQRLWRFRPGQKVRLHVPIEKLENVNVLPADAVTIDGPDAYLFTQNADTFIRKPIRVLYRDQRRVVFADDGQLAKGTFVVQNGAAQLNRMLKAQSNVVPKGYHMHADGSLHKNGEPE